MRSTFYDSLSAVRIPPLLLILLMLHKIQQIGTVQSLVWDLKLVLESLVPSSPHEPIQDAKLEYVYLFLVITSAKSGLWMSWQEVHHTCDAGWMVLELPCG